ncbi:cell division protein FtsA [Parvibaculum sp.]|uniref:cell division protein FtsA n=1 Tax=Parvibaculum sp. TaxID=2024848 RepID=UPI001DEB7795|nr:cell division protein FtsA [Parvibaculum sp.]MBX3488633.1 cell division protein FtsA [Parvibaculum sp.]MCW5727484.1 cell division protein FtsA [Parvibaculum sp.]
MNMVSLGSRSFQGRPVAAGRSGTIAALDVGSSKISCFIARIEAGRIANGHAPVRVIGIGHQVSRGIRAGTVVDMDAAEEAIRVAVDAAERMAGVTIRDVVVGMSGAEPKSQTVGVKAAVAGGEISDSDLGRLIGHAQNNFQPEGRDVLHAIPANYSVDDARGVRDPRGMFGERLGVEVHMVSGLRGPLRNLELCIERCHLTVAGLAVSPYASGLACLVEDEMDLGVAVIDMGGGTTSLGIFFEGAMVYCDAVSIGGNHITNDIARGLSTPLAHAERMKTLYGSALASPSDEREMIDVPQVGESDADAANHIPRSMLTGIIQPRLEETFELVRDRMEASGYGRLAGRRVVLTGGASQLNGARELAARMLDKQVRVGQPIRLTGLAEATGGPAFSTCAGLLTYSQISPLEAAGAEDEADNGAPGGQLRRFGRWLKENF